MSKPAAERIVSLMLKSPVGMRVQDCLTEQLLPSASLDTWAHETTRIELLSVFRVRYSENSIENNLRFQIIAGLPRYIANRFDNP